MIQAKTPPRPPARPGDPVPPCADCGTRFGRIKTGATRPVRSSGARFGYDGQLCAGCYEKHDKRQRRVAQKLAEATVGRPSVSPTEAIRRSSPVLASRPRCDNACDLCDEPAEVRFDADEFGIENHRGGIGRVCGQCREELRQERAVRRWHALAKIEVGTHNERKRERRAS